MKTLTAEDAVDLRIDAECWLRDVRRKQVDAIASGAHEVIDRATHRAVSVETLKVLRVLVYALPDIEKYKGTGGHIGPALAEIEEALKP